MNYIRHLSGFFSRVSHDDRLNPTHVSMYVSLFQFWNASRFENPISISRSELMRISKVSSNSTYHKCIRDLHDFGYLHYMPSYNPLKGSRVYLLGFEEAPGCFSDSSHTDSHTGSEQAPVYSHTSINTGSGQVPVRSHPENDTGTGQALVPYINTLNINKQENSLSLEEAQTDSSKKNNVENSKELSCAGEADTSWRLKQPRSTRSRQPDKMVPPSFDLVRQFFVTKGYLEREAEKFYNYFCSNGWLVGGKSPMKDWQAAARNWMLNIKTHSNATHNNFSTSPLLNSTVKDYGEPL